MYEPKPSAIFHRVAKTPPIAVKGQGIYLELEDGRRIIDAVSGAAVTCLGSGHPAVSKAIKEQIDKLCYVYSLKLTNEPAEELARFLVDSGKGSFDLCTFASSGSDAMEGALKTARQYYREIGQSQRTNFIGRELSFHGNSITALSLAYHPIRRAYYYDALDHEHFHHVSPAYARRFQWPEETEKQYVERLRQELEDKFIELGPDTVIGFCAETVSGSTIGCVPAPKGYFKAMKSVCQKYGALLILDEVMCGMGRMGTMHAWESFGDGISPDLQVIAKCLGAGFASIGAVLISKTVADGVRKGYFKHGHTYQQNPLACATALAVQKVIASENLVESCRRRGKYLEILLKEKLQDMQSPLYPFIFDIRGGGLFWGVEFDFTGADADLYDFKGQRFATLLQAQCLEDGLVIIGLTGGADLEGNGDHICLAPAYNVTEEELELIVDKLSRSAVTVLASYRVTKSKLCQVPVM